MTTDDDPPPRRRQTGAPPQTWLSGPTAWHARSAREVEHGLATDASRGLSAEAFRQRRARFGPNEPSPSRPEPWWEEAVEALTEPLTLLLLGVAALYALLGSPADALTILVVILLVAAVEVVNVARAKRAIVSLRALSSPIAVVLRDGQVTTVPRQEIVPGDVLPLLPGERVPADLRLIESVALASTNRV